MVDDGWMYIPYLLRERSCASMRGAMIFKNDHTCRRKTKNGTKTTTAPIEPPLLVRVPTAPATRPEERWVRWTPRAR